MQPTEASMFSTVVIELILASIVSAYVWLKTGRDPLYFTAKVAMRARAAVLQGIASAYTAIDDFKRNYPETLHLVKRELHAED